MPRTLSHAFISKLNNPGRYFDAATKGLHLYIKPSGTRSWVLRITQLGKRRDIGIGSYPLIGLATAREKALKIRQASAEGADPIFSFRHLPASPAPARKPTFEEVAEEYINTNESGWKNSKHRDQWRSTLRQYAYPKIGDKPVDLIETEHIRALLSEIWVNKTETASRVRSRIERVLAAATTRGLRTGPNPATWKGHLENLFPAAKRIQKVVHHAALPYGQITEFLEELQDKTCTSALALEFLILTTSRTGEVRFAKWDEIENDLWIIPAERMKAGREHRVPLTPRCLQILSIARSALEPCSYVFHIKRRPLSNVAMHNLLRRLRPGFTVHGFRSSFRDWVAEETEHSSEVAEMALAHSIQNRVEAAYRRGALLDRRRKLMIDWENYCLQTPTNKEGFEYAQKEIIDS